MLAETVAKSADDTINFGVWGSGPTYFYATVQANRDLEHKITSLNGRKWLFALTYHSEDEFWNIHDRRKHDALCARHDATYLPTVCDKVKVDVKAEERDIHAS